LQNRHERDEKAIGQIIRIRCSEIQRQKNLPQMKERRLYICGEKLQTSEGRNTYTAAL